MSSHPVLVVDSSKPALTLISSMAGRSRGARLGGGLLPRALLLVMAAAAAVQHASAEPECSVVISLKAPPADPFVDQYLNLAEVELYDNADNKITIPALDFTISSVKPVYPSENCNDGIKTADLNGNDVIDPGEGAACSTNANDPYPNITIAFPCSPGLKKVLVYNVGNFGNAQRITQFKLEAFGIGGISKKVYDFNEGTPNKEYTIDGAPVLCDCMRVQSQPC
ncbi:MAG: hypothetical protein J3K34DRAFT_213149 [Monoraphidium minutum]|nr:MAG: hypothetical protein J3K34DRAFT_213149 [Monoraphidium minutum]